MDCAGLWLAEKAGATMTPMEAQAHFSKLADNVFPCDVYLVEDGGDSWTLIAEYDTAEDADHHLAILNRAMTDAYAQGRRAGLEAAAKIAEQFSCGYEVSTKQILLNTANSIRSQAAQEDGT